MIDERILFVGDKSRWSEIAADCLRSLSSKVLVLLWERGDAHPQSVERWAGDRIFCFNRLLKK
ncbi:MAG: hypothetical protein ACTS3R_06175 [Inquilinaceae bacterium]